jgi:cob(I)alamin adenosyltransferase
MNDAGSFSSAPFDAPRLAINRVYTRAGDAGATALAGGQRVSKQSARIECYGTIDELNSFVGAAIESTKQHAAEPRMADFAAILLRVQHELFNAGSILATLPPDVHPHQPRITEADVSRLEQEMDAMGSGLAGLRSFVLPGGCRVNADLHICRTVCRRAERLCVPLATEEEGGVLALKYLNRLSDAFFVWSRWASAILNAPEVLWDPNQAASAKFRQP